MTPEHAVEMDAQALECFGWTCSEAAATWRVVPFTSRSAVFGTRFESARMLARARLAATPSRTSPTANRNTTSAASSAAARAEASRPSRIFSFMTPLSGLRDGRHASFATKDGSNLLKT